MDIQRKHIRHLCHIRLSKGQTGWNVRVHCRERFRGLLSPAAETQTRNADLRHWIELPRQLQGPKGESARVPGKGAWRRVFGLDERQTQCSRWMFGSH